VIGKLIPQPLRLGVDLLRSSVMLHLPHLLSAERVEVAERSSEPGTGILPFALVTLNVTLVPAAAYAQTQHPGEQEKRTSVSAPPPVSLISYKSMQ
jgi:hypothetical protein